MVLHATIRTLLNEYPLIEILKSLEEELQQDESITDHYRTIRDWNSTSGTVKLRESARTIMVARHEIERLFF